MKIWLDFEALKKWWTSRLAVWLWTQIGSLQFEEPSKVWCVTTTWQQQQQQQQSLNRPLAKTSGGGFENRKCQNWFKDFKIGHFFHIKQILKNWNKQFWFKE